MSQEAYIFDIQRFSVQDGPGIRTTVFFKGCPMSCIWCSNPESQKRSPELLYRVNLCCQCRRCIEACPNQAIRVLDDGSLEFDRGNCQACGKCEEVCLNGARRITGKLMNVDEVMEIAMKDRAYYRKSGGGVTASGGEPTSQPAFLSELFQKCQRQGLHTTLDTCGYVDWDTLEPILDYVDLALYDIKSIDKKIHKKLTGVDNKVVLNNARQIVNKGVPLIIRVPLVPDCNASPENIHDIAQFALELGGIEVNLLPYHKFGQGKYEALGLNYQLEEVEALTAEQVDHLAEKARSYGVPVKVIY
ncbi:glycyl-radical enzyme activating protein [Chloroflexota bacterium]